MLEGHFQTLFAITRGQSPVAARGAIVFDHAEDGRIVFDDQDRRRAHPLASRAIGMPMVKVLPVPGSLSTRIEPPCAATMDWTMLNPSPHPPAVRASR